MATEMAREDVSVFVSQDDISGFIVFITQGK
jgi:hypothetical protein